MFIINLSPNYRHFECAPSVPTLWSHKNNHNFGLDWLKNNSDPYYGHRGKLHRHKSYLVQSPLTQILFGKIYPFSKFSTRDFHFYVQSLLYILPIFRKRKLKSRHIHQISKKKLLSLSLY